MALIKNKCKLFYFMLIAYSFFAILSCLSPIFWICMSALMVASVVLLDDNEALCFLTYASCFMACFNVVSKFLKILDLTMSIWLLKKFVIAIKYKNKKNMLFICVMLIFFLLLFIYSLILTNFHLYKLWQSMGILLTIGTFYLISNISIKNLTLTLSTGLIVSSLGSLFAYYTGIHSLNPLIDDSLCGFRFSAYFNYVNALALYCGLCQACLLTLFLTNKLNIKKWCWILIAVTFIGLCTISKSFILITILTYAIAIIIAFIHSNNKKTFVKILCISGVIVGILCLIFHNYVELIIKRFYAYEEYGSALNVITTGRLGIWKIYFNKWSSKPLYILFGCGITAPSACEYTPHNLFISILYRLGIVGVLALIGIIVFIFKNAKLNKHIAYYLPVFIVLINAFFEDISSSLFTCLPLLIALCFITKCKQTQNN